MEYHEMVTCGGYNNCRHCPMQKQVQTSLLNIACEERGNAGDPCVLFLHGFPDDAQTWRVVMDRLAENGYPALAPYLRGYGNTNFLSPATMRSGQYTAFVTDMIEFTHALHIEKFVLVGHDWGATVSDRGASVSVVLMTLIDY